MVRRRDILAALVLIGLLSAATASERLDLLNAQFLKHVDTLATGKPQAAALVRASWAQLYQDSLPEAFVTASLTTLYPDFNAAMQRFDRGDWTAAAEAFAALRPHDDPYVAAAALYYQARSLAAAGANEEVEALLSETLTENSELDGVLPEAPHLWLLFAHSAARNLRFEAAAERLAVLDAEFPDAPELITVSARQLALELEARTTGKLAEAAELMGYVADRLQIADAGDSVRDRQARIIALLDDMIEQAEQQEQQQRQQQQQAGGQPQPAGGQAQGGMPQNPAEESTERVGQGQIGELHAAPDVEPGEAWGKLPPAEREQILQTLRERYPARYRQLVEQYYRTLAEQP